MKLIIIHLQLDAFKKRPVQVQLMLVNELGAELSRFMVPISLFSNPQLLEIEMEVTLSPKIKGINSHY